MTTVRRLDHPEARSWVQVPLVCSSSVRVWGAAERDLGSTTPPVVLPAAWLWIDTEPIVSGLADWLNSA
jgi:hypothetical protein